MLYFYKEILYITYCNNCKSFRQEAAAVVAAEEERKH